MAQAIQTDATEIVIQGDNILKYDNLNYQGTDFNGDKQDVSGMTHFHLDYYTGNTTALEFFLINDSGEIAYNIQSNLGITTGSWVSLNIPLSNWPIDLTTIREFKVVGNGTIHFDNFYFYNSNTPSVYNNKLLCFSMFPNPTTKKADSKPSLWSKNIKLPNTNAEPTSPCNKIKKTGSTINPAAFSFDEMVLRWTFISVKYLASPRQVANLANSAG